MQKIPLAFATLLCASSALAQPSTVAAEGDAESSSSSSTTRTVALWTHGITGAASLVGGAVYGIRGLKDSDVSKYQDECKSGVPGACERFEATERERRVDQSIGASMFLYSVTSLSGLALLGSTDPTRIDASQQVASSVFYGTSAALSLVTAGLFMHTLKLRSDFGDATDACFEGNCSEAQALETDIGGSLVWPLSLCAVSYAVSTTATVWLEWAARNHVSLAPTLDPKYAGATLTGSF